MSQVSLHDTNSISIINNDTANNIGQKSVADINQRKVPEELQNARPSNIIKGIRIAAGILTLGFSELGILIFRGLKSLFSTCKPVQEPIATRVSETGSKTVPNELSESNKTLLTNFDRFKKLPEEYENGVHEAVERLNKEFGNLLEFNSVKDLYKKQLIISNAYNYSDTEALSSAVVNKLKNYQGEITPQVFSDAIYSSLKTYCQVTEYLFV